MILLFMMTFTTFAAANGAATYEMLESFNQRKVSAWRTDSSLPFFNELQIRPDFSENSKSGELRFKLTPQYSQRKKLETRLTQAKTTAGKLDRLRVLSQEKALLHRLVYSYIADKKILDYIDKLEASINSIASRQSASFDIVLTKSELKEKRSEVAARAKATKRFLLETVQNKSGNLKINSSLDFKKLEAEFKKVKDIPFEKTILFSHLKSKSSEVGVLKKLEELDSKSYLDFIGVEGELEGEQEMAVSFNYTIPFGKGPKEDFKEYEIKYETLYGKSQFYKSKTNVASLLNKASSLEKTFITLEKLYSKSYTNTEMLGSKLKQQKKLLSLYIKRMETKEEAFDAFLEFLSALPSSVDIMKLWSKNGQS